jgi:cytochrome bd-type quinol oxidase subunit 2
MDEREKWLKEEKSKRMINYVFWGGVACSFLGGVLLMQLVHGMEIPFEWKDLFAGFTGVLVWCAWMCGLMLIKFVRE